MAQKMLNIQIKPLKKLLYLFRHDFHYLAKATDNLNIVYIAKEKKKPKVIKGL